MTALATAYLMAGNAGGLRLRRAHRRRRAPARGVRQRRAARRPTWRRCIAASGPARWRSPSRRPARASPTSRRARRRHGDGHYLVRGAKIFISGGDHDLTENIVHMTLARIDGAPRGHQGRVALRVPEAPPRARRTARSSTTTSRSPASIHKIGWRGLPSVALDFGERGDCHGWLVGEPHQGIRYMFQMMNEARIMVGINGVATASVAYHEALAYARARTQGRPVGAQRSGGAAGRRSSSTPTCGACCCARRRSSRAALALLARAVAATPTSREHARRRAERGARAAAPRPAHAGREVVPGRAGLRGERARGADPRRLRLLERVPARGVAARSEAQHDPRGHDRHPGAGPARPQGRRAAARRSRRSATRSRPRARAPPAGVDRVDPEVSARAWDRRADGRARAGRATSRRCCCTRRLPRPVLDVVVAWQWLEQAAVAREGLARHAQRGGPGYYRASSPPRSTGSAPSCRTSPRSSRSAGGEDSYARMRPEWF